SSRTLYPDTMGFLTPAQVPVTNFLANNFVVCDRWFAPLPTSTQPNRIMSWKGSTHIDQSQGIVVPTSNLLPDWLEAHKIPWRVYHSGISFFMLLGRLDLLYGPNFCQIERLTPDFANEDRAKFPKVVLVEPCYR